MSAWVKDRIEKYDFEENRDYFIPVANSGDGIKKRPDGILVDKKTGKVIPIYKKKIKIGEARIKAQPEPLL